MGKRKKENLRNQFKESIDPRFSGIFKTESIEQKKNVSCNLSENMSRPTYQNESSGFQTFVSSKLSDYLDKSIKEVDRPVVDNDIFRNRIEGIRLFSDSEIITKLQPVESVPVKPKKKKHKKDKSFDKESLKDAIVTVDWIQRQAQILNS